MLVEEMFSLKIYVITDKNLINVQFNHILSICIFTII